MYLSDSEPKRTVGGLLARLREVYRPGSADLCRALNTTSSTYLKIERDQRDLSFLMAVRLCAFYHLDIDEFIAMLSDEELARKDLSGIKALRQRARKKEEAARAKMSAADSENPTAVASA